LRALSVRNSRRRFSFVLSSMRRFCYVHGVVLKLIVQVLLAFLVFRLLGSVVSTFRNRGQKRQVFDRTGDNDGVKQTDYKELTPYDIEDAEYEDLPKRD